MYVRPALVIPWDTKGTNFVYELYNKLGLSNTGDPEYYVTMSTDKGELVLEYKGRYLVMPEYLINRGIHDFITFDPLNNKNIMKFLFDVFVDTYEGSPYIVNYYKVYYNGTRKSSLHLYFSDNTEITTNAFYNESLKYAEAIDYVIAGVPLRDYNEVDQEIIIPEGPSKSTKSKKRG